MAVGLVEMVKREVAQANSVQLCELVHRAERAPERLAVAHGLAAEARAAAEAQHASSCPAIRR